MRETTDPHDSIVKVLEFFAGSILGAILGIYFEHLTPLWLTILAIAALIILLLIILFPKSRKVLILSLLGLSIGLFAALTIQLRSVQSSTKTSPDGMTQVFVPAGEFLMGSLLYDPPAAYIDEIPQHRVYLDPFWIDKTEVTNAMFHSCVRAGACQIPSDTGSATRQKYYFDPQYADYPVIYVSWHEAKRYCDWAGRRLPTEAEWEKAARGEDGRIFPWGNNTPTVDLLNFNLNIGDTVRVGNYSAGASPYGVLDMAGNVWEWVADWYDKDYYNQLPSRNPQGPPSGEFKIVRGGGWDNDDLLVRTAYRSADSPTIRPEYRGHNVGFRCAQSP